MYIKSGQRWQRKGVFSPLCFPSMLARIMRLQNLRHSKTQKRGRGEREKKEKRGRGGEKRRERRRNLASHLPSKNLYSELFHEQGS